MLRTYIHTIILFLVNMQTNIQMSNEIIANKLLELEQIHNISIIFSVDAGSRSYGCNTESSDYDIRFVYFYNDKKQYLKVSKYNDTIIGFSDDHMLDWTGWDIRKAVGHLKESNPGMLEWLSSPIVYVDKNNFKANCLKISNDMHSHLSLMYHYFNMAKNNWKTWIENKPEIICKKYFYVIRPLANLVHIMDKFLNFPNDSLELIVNFDSLIDVIKHTTTEEIHVELKQLIEKKRHLTEKEMCSPNLIVNAWILDTFYKFENLVKKDKSGESDIDFKVQSIIKTHKKLTNESKKIKDIVASCGYTARINYLSAIGLALQLLWFDANPDKDTRDLPIKIHTLIKTLELPHDVSTQIKNIIDNLEQELTEQKDTNISKEDFQKYFIEQGLRCIYKDNTTPTEYENDLPIEEIINKLGFSENVAQLILNSKRNDSIEFGMRNFFELLWLLGNVEDVQSARPKDIINTGDPTNTIPSKLLTKAKQTIAELRPKHIVGRNEILDNWFKTIVESFDAKVKIVQTKLETIKEENVKKRLHHSTKDVKPERFDELIFESIGLMII